MKLSAKIFKRKCKLLLLVYYSGNRHRQLGPNLSFSRHHVEKVFNKYLDIPDTHKFFKIFLKESPIFRTYVCYMQYIIYQTNMTWRNKFFQVK